MKTLNRRISFLATLLTGAVGVSLLSLATPRLAAQESAAPPEAPAPPPENAGIARPEPQREPPPAPLAQRPRVQERLRALKAELAQLREKLQDLTASGQMEKASQAKRRIGELEQQLQAAAGQPDRSDLRQQLRKMRDEVRELRQQGRNEEADQLEAKARSLVAQLQQPGPGGLGMRPRPPQPPLGVPMPRRQMQPLDGSRDVLTMVPGRPGPEGPQIRPLPPGAFGPRPGPGAELENRLQHLRAAVENLRAAGLPEVADKLATQADQWQRKLDSGRGPGAPGPFAMAGPSRELRELQGAVKELRQAVRELRRRLEDLSPRRD